MTDDTRYITFELGGMIFEYDEQKNQYNIETHGISFRNAARVFFDYDRIEYYDEENSAGEDRYNTIGDLSAGNVELKFGKNDSIIGDVRNMFDGRDDVLFVVYTERIHKEDNGRIIEVTRLISARYATSFERGLYYGKY